MNKEIEENFIIFNKLKNQDIFAKSFEMFIKNNKIQFSKKGIAIIYGPNGVGKSSLVKVLSGDEKTEIDYKYNGKNSKESIDFHIINDQNNRNIISGEEQDFLLGDQIKKEFELSKNLDNEFTKIKNENIHVLEKYGIYNKKSNLINYFNANKKIKYLVEKLANQKTKGKNIDINEYISLLEDITKIPTKKISNFEQEKLNYLIKDMYDAKLSVITKLRKISILPTNKNIDQLYENEEAIRILEEFIYKTDCIVCDTTNINPKELLKLKNERLNKIIKSLGEDLSTFLDNINFNNGSNDPFSIHDSIFNAIKTGDSSNVETLGKEINLYENIFVNNIIEELKDIYVKSNIFQINCEYEQIINKKIDITDEDILFIQDIINNNMNKTFIVKRDKDRRIRITLNDNSFLNEELERLPLSTGEQNFLSLTFELLKAKNTINKSIIVIDDPISSFDSFYRYKIAYAILKNLENKKIIILSHNTDLLRILDVQFGSCFNLYFLNNIENQENGFIELKQQEKPMLISVEKLIKTFRLDIWHNVVNEKLFLISIIPFMRKYSDIIGDEEIVNDLSKLMHINKDISLDLNNVYWRLFDRKNKINKERKKCMININDILEIDINNITSIVDESKYPLLNRALIHSLTYLFLRISVEKKLISKFNIKINNDHITLGEIIEKCFPTNSSNIEFRKNRIFLLSKKSLLNEFNHFEGTLNIFQPAIDINDDILEREKNSILDFLEKL